VNVLETEEVASRDWEVAAYVFKANFFDLLVYQEAVKLFRAIVVFRNEVEHLRKL
jgi:hypothetical protein